MSIVPSIELPRHDSWPNGVAFFIDKNGQEVFSYSVPNTVCVKYTYIGLFNKYVI